MNVHPAADLFPLMSEEEFASFKEDIREHGQIDPIVIHEGAILDGRNRWQACVDLGRKPKTRQWDGKGSLTAFVISANLQRRHLTPSQRGAIAAEALALFEAEARERMTEGAKQGASITNTGIRPTEIIPGGEAREQAAEAFNTNPHYVSDAKKLKSDPETADLFDQVKAGDLSIPQAKKEAKKRQRNQLVETTQRVIDLAGDDEGRVERARVRKVWLGGISRFRGDLLCIDLEAVFASLDPGDMDTVRAFADDAADWLAGVQGHVASGQLRLVN